jgi:cytochrome P450
LRRTKAWLEAVLAWRHTYGRDPEVREAAIDATARLSPMLLDVIRDRRDRPGEDIISWLWAIGPSVASDWNEADVLANTTFLFEAGSETTSLLMCTLVKRLLDEPAHRRAEIIEDTDAMRWYTDEVLRHSTVVHWRARQANQDVELGGVRIEAGSMVHPVNAAANRDAARWERPTEFDPSRPGLAGHLAFNIGPRHCAGAHLARLQTTEAVQALFRAFPDIALDKEAPRPEMRGYVSRAWRPVWLRFTPRSADDARRAVLSPPASSAPASVTPS